MSASSAQPPANVTANSEAYLMFGLRADAPVRIWHLSGSANFGDGLRTAAGRWLLLDGAAERSWTSRNITLGLSAALSSLNYFQPFRYNAHTAQLTPSATLGATNLNFTIAPQATAGVWTDSSDNGSIGVVGSNAILARVSGSFAAMLTGTILDGNTGAYRGAAFDVISTTSSTTLGAQLRSWRTPTATEWGYLGYLVATVTPAMQLNLQLARSVTDAVLGTPPSFGVSVGVSVRVGGRAITTTNPVAAVGARAGNGRQVRFTIEQSGASSAAVSGSFTDWQPVPMQRDGKKFTVELIVPPGTHHYGFLLDGKDWYVPANATGIVDDDFGRKNATLFIERL